MVEHFLIPKEKYLNYEDNPFRILALLTYAGLTVTVKRATMRYPECVAKLKEKYIYVYFSEYHGWRYTVNVTTTELPWDNEFGTIFSSEHGEDKEINSEEFYDLFKQLYEKD